MPGDRGVIGSGTGDSDRDGNSGTPGRESTAQPRVVVIGGGVAGLVAARELAQAKVGEGTGARVTLVEASDRLGGRVRRETVAGIPLDVGAEAFAVRGGAVAELLDELGIGDRLITPAPLGSWLVSGLRAAPAPVSGYLGVPVHPLARRTVAALGLPGALRAALEPLLPRRIGADATNLADLVRARLGHRALERLVAPVALGVYSANPRDLPIGPELRVALERHRSLTTAARALRSAAPAGAAVAGLRGGMGDLVDALERESTAAGVEVRTGAAATAVVPRDSQWEVRVEGAPSIPCDAVIFACAEAYRAVAPPTEAPTRTLVEVVTLVIDDERLDPAPRGTGALVSPGTDSNTAADASRPAAAPQAKALTHTTAKWPDRFASLPSGTHVLRLSYGSAAAAPVTTGLDDAALERRVLADASLILGLELRPGSL
ncbi:MAG: protoporphyrinogen/coproporphyrinogen oxidase, partial [Leucobacter sp.]